MYINHTQPTIARFAPTKGWRSKRQLPNLFTVANSQYHQLIKLTPIPDYWSVDRENLGTRSEVVLFFGERKNKERNGETPLRTGKYFEWIIKQLLNSAGYEELCRSSPRPSASVENTLLDLQNSSYPTQAHSIIANYYTLYYFIRGLVNEIVLYIFCRIFLKYIACNRLNF